MPKTKEQKQKIIKDLIDGLKKQQAAVLFEFTGTNSKTLFELRDKVKQAGCQLVVVKKTLLKKALEKAEIKGLGEKLKQVQGQLALIFGFADETCPAKICQETAKQVETIKILGGSLASELLTAEKVLEISALPSKQELLARLVCSLRAPIANYVYVLRGNIKGLINVLTRAKT